MTDQAARHELAIRACRVDEVAVIAATDGGVSVRPSSRRLYERLVKKL